MPERGWITMLCREIIPVIEAAYPREAVLDFDNVGLLAGRAEKEVNRVYLALDATDDSMFPLLFSSNAAI